MARLQRVEIWSDLACNSGARLGVFSSVLRAQDQRALDGNDQLTLTVPLADGGWQYVQAQRVVRVLFSDGAFDEWRIARIEQERQRGELGTISCESVLLDLRRGMVERIEANGLAVGEFELLGLSPTALITNAILPSAPSYFAVGTVDPTADVPMPLDSMTPLQALRELATRTDSELTVRRNGITDYKVDLLSAIGASAGALDVRLGKNLRGIKRTVDASKQVTRVYPRGAAIDEIRLTIGDAPWKVVSVATNNVVLVDPNSSDGPIAFDDQFNGLYLEAVDGTKVAISDTIASSQTVVTADGTKFTADDIVYFRRNSSGAELTYLDAPAEQALYGVIAAPHLREDVAFVRNLVANAMLNGSYAAGIPSTGWAKVNGTGASYAENTASAYTRRGGKSCHITPALDGDGIETNSISITPTDKRPYFSGYFSIYVVSGRVRVELYDVTNNRAIPSGDEGRATNSVAGTWIELGVAGIDLLAVNCSSVRLRIVQDGAAACEFYVDSAQLTQTAGQEPFYDKDAATELWYAGQNKLLDDAAPRVEVAASILDLARLDGVTWPYNTVALGQTAQLTDAGLGLAVSTRVVRVARDLLRDADTSIELSSAPELLTDVLLRPALRRRFGVEPGAGFDEIGVADPTVGPPQASDGSVSYPIVFDRETGYIEVYIKEAGSSAGATVPPEQGSHFAGFLYPGTSEFSIATRTSWYVRALFVAYTRDQVRGRSSLFGPTQAVSAGTAPSGPPTDIAFGTITDTTVPLTITLGDSSALTRIYRNGVIVKTLQPGETAWTDTGRSPGTQYDYECDHFKNYQASAKYGPESATTTGGTLGAPTACKAWGSVADGVILCTDNPDPTAQTVIERCGDSGGSPDGNWVELLVWEPGKKDDVHGDGSGVKHFRSFARKAGWYDSSPTAANAAEYFVAESSEPCP